MRLIKGISGLVIIMILAFLGILAVPRFRGYVIFAVVSGSMEPELHVGELIFVKPCSFETLKEGDVVTYSLNEGEAMITHRVVGIDRSRRAIRTKGDANEEADYNWIEADTIVGRVEYHIPGFGRAASLIAQPAGKLYVMAVLLWLLALEIILDKSEGRKERRRKGVYKKQNS